MCLKTLMRRSVLAAATVLLALQVSASPKPPKDLFGFTPGDDYKLASYEQIEKYLQHLADESDRAQLRVIGETPLGRKLYLMTISTPENLANLDKYRDISATLARARLNPEAAEKLAIDGKAVVWIDAGLHATEMAHGQMAPQLAYRVITEESAEMQHIRENVIFLFMPNMNPDGLEIVRKWYNSTLDTPFEATNPPEIYHHYVGHDNNRDFFMNNMPESRATAAVLYNEWYPQIIYNQHQISPSWARIVIPPYSDPVNPAIHPGVTNALNEIGSAMGNRFAMEDMPGAISDVGFSMWWNGGMRTVPYFHNMIGILTETGHNWPSPAYYDPKLFPRMRELRDNGGAIGKPLDADLTGVPDAKVLYPYPWEGGESHFSEPVKYMIEGSIAVLRSAADSRIKYLTNIYRMGRDSIEAGKSGTQFYVIPADQRNADEAYNLVNILRQGGVEIEKATESFRADGKRYAAGSFVIPASQAFRPYVVDLLETQTFPDTRLDPSGQTRAPYDITGWTLPMQMAVDVVQVSEELDVNTTSIAGDVSLPEGTVEGRSADYGYVLPYQMNLAIKVANHLMSKGEMVYSAGEAFGRGDAYPAGSFVIKAGSNTAAMLESIAKDSGATFYSLGKEPDVTLTKLSLPKVGLYKSYVASMDEGWTRWVLEQYGFDVVTLFDKEMRMGKFDGLDAIIIPHPDGGAEFRNANGKLLNGHAQGTMPEKYTGGMGLEGVLAIDKFVRAGGTLLTFGSANDFAIHHLGLPIRNVVGGTSSKNFSIPGSLIRAKVDTSEPLAFGLPEELSVTFVRGAAFAPIGQKDCIDDYLNQGQCQELRRGGRPLNGFPEPVGHTAAVSYADKDLLLSGWSKGDKYIAGRTAVAEVAHGDGKVVLYGFRPQFRGQPRGTYKLVFNALMGASAE